MSDQDDQDEEDRERIERISKAPARYSFMIDVGKVLPEQADAFLKKVKKRMKGKKFDNPMTGDDDTFLPDKLP